MSSVPPGAGTQSLVPPVPSPSIPAFCCRRISNINCASGQDTRAQPAARARLRSCSSANPAVPGASLALPCCWGCHLQLAQPCPRTNKPSGAGSTAQAGGAPWKLEILTSRSRNRCCVGLVKVLSLLVQPALAFQAGCRDGFIAALHLFPIFFKKPFIKGKKKQPKPKGKEC